MPAHHVRDTGFNYTYVITESKKVLRLFTKDKLDLDSDMSSFFGKNLIIKINGDVIRSLKSGKWYVGATSDLRPVREEARIVSNGTISNVTQ